MSSFFVAEQRSVCRLAFVNAQLDSSSANPIFRMNVDGASVASTTFDRASSTANAVQSYMLMPTSNGGPAIGSVFQVTAENAIIKDVQFVVESLVDFTQKLLFHAVKLNYINDPNPVFYVDGSQVNPTNLSSLTDSQGKPRSTVLYFPSLTTGYVLHVSQNPINPPTNNNYSVGNLIMSYSPIASAIDE